MLDAGGGPIVATKPRQELTSGDTAFSLVDFNREALNNRRL